jgi:hypothetical protein
MMGQAMFRVFGEFCSFVFPVEIPSHAAPTPGEE